MMADQDIDLFDYINEQRRDPLSNKQLYMPAEHMSYKKQHDKRVAKLLHCDFSLEELVTRLEFGALLKKSEHN